MADLSIEHSHVHILYVDLGRSLPEALVQWGQQVICVFLTKYQLSTSVEKHQKMGTTFKNS